MRLIDADALKEKKAYSHERHEKIVPVAEIDWSPTIDAIPVEWLKQYAPEKWATYMQVAVEIIIEAWQKEQEAEV